MATNYPNALDIWEDKIASQPVMAQHMNNMQDSIYQLQLKVGADATSLVTTFDYKINNFICASNHMYFYEDTAPTGWTATITAGDRVLGIGGAGSGDYQYTATLKGTWTIDGYASDSHNHQWSYFYSPYNYSFNKNNQAVPIHSAWRSISNIGKRNQCFGTYFYSKNTSDAYDIKSRVWGDHGYTNNDSHTHTFTPGWRPPTAIGVIAYYSGP